MTEADWNTCCEPETILAFLRDSGTASERKLRLFACACCRRVWALLSDERGREAVRVAEQFADGLATERQRRASEAGAHAGRLAADFAYNAVGAAGEAQQAAAWATRVAVAAAAATKQAIDPAAAYAVEHAAAAAIHAAEYAAARGEWEGGWPALTRRMESVRARERQAQAALLRCVFGPLPFRPVSIALSLLRWNDGLVVKMAQAIYDERQVPSGHLDPQRLAILADAL